MIGESGWNPMSIITLNFLTWLLTTCHKKQLPYIDVYTSLHTEEKMLKLENAVHFGFQSRQGQHSSHGSGSELLCM